MVKCDTCYGDGGYWVDDDPMPFGGKFEETHKWVACHVCDATGKMATCIDCGGERGNWLPKDGIIPPTKHSDFEDQHDWDECRTCGGTGQITEAEYAALTKEILAEVDHNQEKGEPWNMDDLLKPPQKPDN